MQGRNKHTTREYTIEQGSQASGGLLSDQVSEQVGEQPTEQVSTLVSTLVQNGGLVSGLPSDQVSDQVSDQPSDQVQELLKIVSNNTLSIVEIQDYMNIHSRRYLRMKIVAPSVNNGLLEMEYPDSPNHPRQKYYLTEKGKAVLEQIKPQENL